VPATLLVTSTADSGAGTLRGEIGVANPGDTIEFSVPVGSTITLTSGEIAIGKNLTINGTIEKITVSGNFNSRLFEVSSGTVTIENVTLINGTAAGLNGGAILVDSGATLKLTSDTLSNNSATLSSTSTNGFGGAVENDGTLTVTSSTLQNNNALASGGAIDSFSGSAGTLTVTSSKFYGNFAGDFGGAISTADPTTLTSDTFGGTKSTTPGNVAANGGGAVDAFGTAGTTTLTITKSTFTDNKVTSGGYGGAVSTVDNLSDTFDTYTGNSAPYGGGAIDYFVENFTSTAFTATETIQDDTFTGNAGEGGGGVYSNINIDAGTATVKISDNTFFQNMSIGSTSFVNGGGLYIKHTTESTASTSGSITATIADDTFFQNSTKNHGGGLAVVATVGAGGGANTVALVSLTVFQNTAVVDGGGLYVNLIGGSTLSVDNTILDGNSINAAGPQDLTVAGGSAAITDDGFNLVGTSDTQFTALTDISNNTTGLATSLAQNGAAAGVPKTLALSTSSVGHDTGDQTLAGTKDERGKTRQVGKVSIGAEDPDAI
jgi:hypothetical protein